MLAGHPVPGWVTFTSRVPLIMKADPLAVGAIAGRFAFALRNVAAVKRGAMPATPAELFAFLDRLGIAHSTVSHPPLFTVEKSRALRGKIPGGHTKNLFLKAKTGALFLVVALEDAQITSNGCISGSTPAGFRSARRSCYAQDSASSRAR